MVFYQKGKCTILWGAYQVGMLGTFLNNQWVNMPPMDISDVAYDAFWINGKPSIEIAESWGKRVKLRIINAGASLFLCSFFERTNAGGCLRARISLLTKKCYLSAMGSPMTCLFPFP